MLYTSQLAKEYLEHSAEIGKRNAEIEKAVDPIIKQMGDTLFQNKNSFKKTMERPLKEECVDYLEHAGIDVKLESQYAQESANTFALKAFYEYKFTF